MESGREIDLTLFNLVYTRKSDGRFFLCRLITKMDYILIDTKCGLVLRLTEARLKRWYSPVKHLNRINKRKPWTMNFGKKRIA